MQIFKKINDDNNYIKYLKRSNKYFYHFYLFILTQSYFRTPKDARLNSTHYILMKMDNKKELKSIAEENSGHLDFKDFLKIYNYCTNEPY